MSVDYSCLFPTGMLTIGLHPQTEMEVELCWAYNRWLTEKVLPESSGRFFSMLTLPFSDPDECLRQVETFGDRKHVGGFMVTTVRNNLAVNDNRYMKVYRAIEERGLVLSFHSGPNWGEPIFKSCNRFLIGARARLQPGTTSSTCRTGSSTAWASASPSCRWCGSKSGLAWVPFLMQKLDHEYMLRPSEAPLLKKKPRDYMRDMFYSSQPMEIQDMEALEMHVPHDQCGDAAACTPRTIRTGTSTCRRRSRDLPFLSEKAKHNILGGTAARLFKLPPRNEKQKENLIKFGNLTAD